MKRLTRLFIITALLMAAFVPVVIQAQTYYYRWVPGFTYGCADVGGSVEVTLTGRRIEWNLPAGAFYNAVLIENGSTLAGGPFSAPTGSGSSLLTTFIATIPGTYPVTFEYRFETLIGGSIVYTSSLVVNCAGDGGGTVTIVNAVGSSAAGGSGSPSFTDGRLNPDAGAPVAIYCSATRVTILRINAQTSQGERALEVPVGRVEAGLAQAISSNRNVFIAGDGVVSLYALSSNELQVQANLNGVYNFIFAASRCGYEADGSATNTVSAEAGATGSVTIVVQRGDTLGRLATRFNTTVGAIAAANGISPNGVIFVGQRLIIPTGATGATGGSVVQPPSSTTPIPTPSAPVEGSTTHVVQRGETLFRIAIRYGVTVSALQAANNLANPNLIFAGQVLIIP